MRLWACLVVSSLGSSLGSCGTGATSPDARLLADAAARDALLPGPADAGQLVRVSGHVESDGHPVGGAVATLIEGVPFTATTTAAGDFFFDFGVGDALAIRVEAQGLIPMIRRFRAQEDGRPRAFALLGPAALASLGHEIDPAKGLVAVDFRGAAAPRAVVLARPAGEVVPAGFSATRGATVLLLGDVPPGPIELTAATCRPCDQGPILVAAGAVTWFDFDCDL